MGLSVGFQYENSCLDSQYIFYYINAEVCCEKKLTTYSTKLLFLHVTV